MIPATNGDGSDGCPAMIVQVTNAIQTRIDDSDTNSVTNSEPSDDDTYRNAAQLRADGDDEIKENEDSFFDTASVGTDPTTY